MSGYTDITIRVPNEQIDMWRSALQHCQNDGVSVDADDGKFIHPIDMVDHETSDQLSCEIIKIKQSRTFDIEQISDVVGIVKEGVGLAKSIIGSIGNGAGHLAGHL